MNPWGAARTEFTAMKNSHFGLLNPSKLAGLALALACASLSVAHAQEAATTPSPAAPPAAEAAPATPPAAPAGAASDAPAAATPAPTASPPAADATPNAAPPDPATLMTGQAPPASPSTTPAATNDVTAPGAAPPTPSVVATPSPSAAAHSLPRDLSPWGMFMQADIIVKAVMIGLLFASVVTWTVWLAKTIELWAVKRRLRNQLHKLNNANSLAEAGALVDSKRGAVPAMIRAAVAETRASWDVADKYAIKERITARLQRVELAAGRDVNRGTGVLATIGSTAPFVGLFGTVWGIMNSFIGISEAQTTNLAIVAPGIAEALLATAFGLVAAIPAVIIYNHFARAISGYKALVGDASVAVLGLVSRDFDRGVRPEMRAAE